MNGLQWCGVTNTDRIATEWLRRQHKRNQKKSPQITNPFGARTQTTSSPHCSPYQPSTTPVAPVVIHPFTDKEQTCAAAFDGITLTIREAVGQASPWSVTLQPGMRSASRIKHMGRGWGQRGMEDRLDSQNPSAPKPPQLKSSSS